MFSLLNVYHLVDDLNRRSNPCQSFLCFGLDLWIGTFMTKCAPVFPFVEFFPSLSAAFLTDPQEVGDVGHVFGLGVGGWFPIRKGGAAPQAVESVVFRADKISGITVRAICE
jgi:hypothetical protein